METLEILGLALGLGALAGINLYLTVFATGLAIHFKWILLSPEYQSLEILGHPVIVIIAGLFYFAEFFADKVPWIDSAWDTVHTAIRPIGGALLAATILGESHPVFDVVLGLIGGGAALTTHVAKAGTRLLVNTSPEPFSNAIVSTGEDLAVLGGLLLLNFHPVLALVVFSVGLLALFFLVPRMFRMIRVMVGLALKKLSGTGKANIKKLSELHLPSQFDQALDAQLTPLPVEVEWAAPVLVGKVRGLEANREGWLCAVKDMDSTLHLVSKAKGGIRVTVLDLKDHKVALEPRVLVSELILYSGQKSSRNVLLFNRSQDPLAAEVRSAIEARIPKLPNSTKPESVVGAESQNEPVAV